jgi:flavorubredoxin
MYWQIWKMIFEEEQQEKNGVDYNKYFIKFISEIFLITNALRS